ncbi:ATP synthase subunit I [Thorsellia kenyensis]|uniref:ATP synthase subunit I n=1 Tax=Thorsellia kenyensis TaxID=1549888 RepID=A0ABV6CCE5_9GAMM
MVKPFVLKEVGINFLLSFLVSCVVFFFDINSAWALLLGALAYNLPNGLNILIGWGYDKQQYMFKGIALNLFFAMMFKYIIVIFIFVLSISYLKLPFFPLMSGYFLGLIFQVGYSLFVT